jgi:hypothetical protein
MPIQESSPVIPILKTNNPLLCIDIYFFKIHSNIVLPSMPRDYSQHLNLYVEDSKIKKYKSTHTFTFCAS